MTSLPGSARDAVEQLLERIAFVEPQVNAIADEVQAMVLGKFDLRPVRREGFGLGRWVLLDYGDVVVHIQHQEDRVFYALDRLWSDCPVIEITAEAK